jgi:hypothetical protein
MLKKALSIFFPFLLLAVIVSSQTPPPPGPPGSGTYNLTIVAFYGTVKIDGSPAPIGTLISARIDSAERDNVTTNITGEYGTQGVFDTTRIVINGGISDQGKTIEFYVNGQKADQEIIWDNGTLNLSNRLNLTSTSPPSPPQTPPSGGGGGAPSCSEDWSCGEWTSCVNASQTRTCTDLNTCGTTKNKPAESQDCEPELPTTCIFGQKRCSEDDVIECVDNDWIAIKTCEFGCFAGICLTEQQMNDKNFREEELEQPSGITGFLINPVNIYVGFLLMLALFGGVLYLKFH